MYQRRWCDDFLSENDALYGNDKRTRIVVISDDPEEEIKIVKKREGKKITWIPEKYGENQNWKEKLINNKATNVIIDLDEERNNEVFNQLEEMIDYDHDGT